MPVSAGPFTGRAFLPVTAIRSHTLKYSPTYHPIMKPSTSVLVLFHSPQLEVLYITKGQGGRLQIE